MCVCVCVFCVSQAMFDTLEDSVESTVLQVKQGAANVRKATNTQQQVRKRRVWVAFFLLCVFFVLFLAFVLPRMA